TIGAEGEVLQVPLRVAGREESPPGACLLDLQPGSAQGRQELAVGTEPDLSDPLRVEEDADEPRAALEDRLEAEQLGLGPLRIRAVEAQRLGQVGEGAEEVARVREAHPGDGIEAGQLGASLIAR